MDDPDLTALVARAQRDRAAFGTLYDRFVPRIYRYHYSRVGNAADAQDLTAQTFLAALEALPRYTARGYFAAWLFTIARRKALDFFRRRKTVALDDVEPFLAQPDFTAAADVRVALRTLKPDERELLQLRYVADLTFAEIAALLGKNEEAVKKSLYRLLARLEQQMEAGYERRF